MNIAVGLILLERKVYYSILQKVQHNDGDITEWLTWFLNCLYRALKNTEATMDKVLYKADFWDKHRNTELNSRQRLIINKLFDGFDGKLKSSKWAKITKCSSDTALRDIKDLIEKDILIQETSIIKGFATQGNDYLGCSSAVAEQAMW